MPFVRWLTCSRCRRAWRVVSPVRGVIHVRGVAKWRRSVWSPKDFTADHFFPGFHDEAILLDDPVLFPVLEALIRHRAPEERLWTVSLDQELELFHHGC